MSLLDGFRRLLPDLRLEDPQVVPNTQVTMSGSLNQLSQQDLGPTEFRQVYQSTVFQLLNYRADNFAPHMMDVRVERRAGEDQDEWEQVEREHPWVRVIRRPNDYMAPLQFWKWCFLNIDGVGHADMIVEGGSRPTESGPMPVPVDQLHPIFPEWGQMSPQWAPDGTLAGWLFQSGGKRLDLEPEDVIRIRRLHPTNPSRTAGLIEALAYEIDQDRAANIYGRDSMQSKGVPDVMLESEDELEKRQIIKLSRDFAAQYGSDRSRVPVSHGGLKIKEVSLSKKEDEFQAQRSFIKDVMYEVAGVHQGLFDSNATEANANQAERLFAKNTAEPALRDAKSQFEFHLERVFGADPDQLRIRLPDNIIPEDRGEQLKNDLLRIRTGSPPNRVLNERGEEEVEGGDIPMIDGTVQALEAAGAGF